MLILSLSYASHVIKRGKHRKTKRKKRIGENCEVEDGKLTEREFERKSVVDCEKYNMWLAEFADRFPCEDIFQINYYYDTADFALFRSDETLRIRQIGNNLKLQYKHNKNHIGNMRISDEYSEKMDELPKSIAINGVETYNIGFMVTQRANFDLGNCVVSLDKNYYLGEIDYEIEVEGENGFDVPEILREVDFQPDSIGKYSRYMEKLLGQGASYEVRK